MEKTLSAPDGSYFAAFNAFPEAVSVHCLADGRCLATNESFTALTGYTVAEVVAARARRARGLTPQIGSSSALKFNRPVTQTDWLCRCTPKPGWCARPK